MLTKQKDWQIFLAEGRGFHKTAKGAIKRPNVFTPDIIQNIAAMAIEKYFMAIFLKRGTLPLNHTMTDLMSAAEMILNLKPDLIETLVYMDHLQQICSLEFFKITVPSIADVPRFLKAVDDVAEIAQREIEQHEGVGNTAQQNSG